MARRLAVALVCVATMVLTAVPAFACGGLVNPNGTVSLVRTTTLAGYRWGVEHYVTSFEFAGGGAEFGSIVPLPGIPKRVTRGGDWTLQRLVREVSPPVPAPTEGDAAGGIVVGEYEIDSLKITILSGGGDAVGRWAKRQGFLLTPDAPEVLDFYAARSPVFMAVRFDPEKAADSGKNVGDGVPIHLRIPTDEPWVPLRILGLGLPDESGVQADVFLLTRTQPALLPVPKPAGQANGLILERSEAASDLLLSDLGSDKGMGWVPNHNMWLSYLKVNDDAGDVKFDLATNVHGGMPSFADAGLGPAPSAKTTAVLSPWELAVVVFMLAGVALLRRRSAHRA